MRFPDYNCSRADNADRLSDGTVLMIVTGTLDWALTRGILFGVSLGEVFPEPRLIEAPWQNVFG